MKVISLDPGVTTGYAIGLIEDGKMEVLGGQERWNHVGLYRFLKDNSPQVVISERFEFRKKAREGLELYSRELIGVTNLYAQIFMEPPHELVMQMPSVIGGFFSDAQLKKDGLWKEGRGHNMDALRHLLHWFTFASGFQYNTKGYESAV
jgi:hypothetical protein